MITRRDKILAARRYAPPLYEVVRADRRGARLRQVSRRALEYTRNAGLTLGEVYPETALARFGTDTATLPAARSWGWGWGALGLVLGALVGGPVGAVIGLGAGTIIVAVRS